jgi:hypothetical protein
VSDFLIKHHKPGNTDGNWVQPAWEYMHSHSLLDKSSLGKIGIWEDGGKIAAVVHFDEELVSLVQARGYTRDAGNTRPVYQVEYAQLQA